MKRTSKGLALLAFACAAASLACEEDYPPYVRLASLRVLAVQSEPVSPGAGETTTLTPLVYVPEGQEVSYAWSWCPLAGPANAGYPCLLSEAQISQAAQGAPIEVPPYDLGNAPTASFTVTFDPERLRPLCRRDPMGMGGAADGGVGGRPDAGALPFELDCSNGFPVQIKLVVFTANDRVETVRTLTLKMNDQQTANTNPVISGLAATFRVADGPPTETFDVPFSDEAISVPRQRQTTIKAIVDPVHSEPFIDRDEMDQPLPANERLFLTWFVESGGTSPERTSYLPMKVPLLDALKSKWTPGSVEDYPAQTSKLYVVIRDNRGGVGWATGSARLVEAQPR